MKKSLAIAVAAAMMLGICPTAAPVNAADSDYKYVYASLDWAEYWQNENVYLASGSTLKSSSEEADARGEYDKGAFDVVTRATKNHGLHRGSFQCDAVIRDTDGKAYEISYWTSEEVSAKDENGQDTTKKVVYAVLTDGSKIQFDKGTITYTENGETKTATMKDYEVKGIKYVPVAVKTEDYADFCKKYSVTEDTSAIEGGYTEKALKAYTKTAEVTADTNGLKVATKNADGTYSFAARKTGSNSGIKNEAQKTVDETKIVKTVRSADDAETYGAFIQLEDGLSGLVHISQISQKRIKSPKDVLNVGDEVQVKVIGIKDGKISLSMKALEEVEEEPVEKVEIPKAEEIGTSLGDLFKNIQL